MRLIPGWFKYMFAGMAVFYFVVTLPILYLNPDPSWYIGGMSPFVSVAVFSLIVAIVGAFGYAAGALVIGWLINLIKYAYRRVVAVVRWVT